MKEKIHPNYGKAIVRCVCACNCRICIAELWRAHRLSQIGHTSDLFSLYRIRERRTHEYV